MADALTLRYIYPPNFQDDPNWPEHPDHKDGHRHHGPRRYILHLTNLSDGTGLSEHRVFTLANHRGPTGKVARRTVIEWIEYDIFGMDVTLYWERLPETIKMALLPGGAGTQSGKIRGPLYDPGTGDGTDGTGDFLVSTTNAAANDRYDIRICFRVKEQPKPDMTFGDAGVNMIYEKHRGNDETDIRIRPQSSNTGFAGQ